MICRVDFDCRRLFVRATIGHRRLPLSHQIKRALLDLVECPAEVLADDSEKNQLHSPRNRTVTSRDGYPETGLPKRIVLPTMYKPYIIANIATNRPI